LKGIGDIGKEIKDWIDHPDRVNYNPLAKMQEFANHVQLSPNDPGLHIRSKMDHLTGREISDIVYIHERSNISNPSFNLDIMAYSKKEKENMVVSGYVSLSSDSLKPELHHFSQRIPEATYKKCFDNVAGVHESSNHKLRREALEMLISGEYKYILGLFDNRSLFDTENAGKFVIRKDRKRLQKNPIIYT
jgi:hypothetical protein